jgi:hypothetical protein
MWLALIPVAAFITAFCVGAVGLWYIARRTKFSQTQTATGQVIHVESPIGTLDVHPDAKLDSRLAQIPQYPGAMSNHPMTPEVVTELHLGARHAQDISATYWTTDPAAQVWDFYRQALPDWPRNLDGARGRELIFHGPDCVCLIRVTTQNDRTLIETSIKPPEYPHVFGSGS